MASEEIIEIIEPKPFEKVGAEFILSGRVPKSFLKTSWGHMDYRILGSYLDIDGIDFAGTVSADVQHNWFSKFKKKLYFSTIAQFSQFNIPFIARSQGRITLRLSTIKEGSDFFLPVIVKGFEPEGGVDPEIEERHKNIGRKVRRYEADLKNYVAEFLKIREALVNRSDIKNGIFEILDQSEEMLEPLSEVEEEKQERALAEKYKEALQWRPFFGGEVHRMEGFRFQVNSGDHKPQHFHVVHKGKGINARFSFPQITLLSYGENSNLIGRKEVKRIQDFFNVGENFQALQEEFEKQILL